MIRQTWVRILLLILLLMGYDEVAAQEGVIKWLRRDVNITVQQNSTLFVEEIHEISLFSGATTLKRVIPANKLEGISNIEIIETNPATGQRSFQLADSGTDHSFQVISGENQQTIQLYFPPNNVPVTKFILRYSVVGALRFYSEGDRLEWQPFGDRVVAPIETSAIVIKLPAEFADEQVVRDSVGILTDKYFNEANKVTFVATDIAPNDHLEVSVIFPHGVVQGSPPRWQTEVDSLAYWTPILQWGSAIVGLLFLLFGPLLVYGWWFMGVRASPGSSTPKYITSPPSDLSPAAAGALLDGKAGSRHILATLLDMAYRGVLNVCSAKEDSASPDGKTEPTFDLYAVAQNKISKPYEVTLYGQLFGDKEGNKCQLFDIRRTLFTFTPELKKQINMEIVQSGYFLAGPNPIRRQYAAFGGAGIIMSLVLALVAIVPLGKFTYLVVCPFLGLAVGAAALIVAGFAAPKRTETGAKEAERWEAFKRYLRDMSIQDTTKYRQRFAKLLPYAVAFGLEKDFIERFASANAPTPKWWGQPEEKLTGINHDRAWAWMGSTDTPQSPDPQPKPEKTRTKSVIRRLNQPAENDPSQPATRRSKPEKTRTKSAIRRLLESPEDAPPGTLLKHIQSKLQAFLKVGNEVFHKAPLLAFDADEKN